MELELSTVDHWDSRRGDVRARLPSRLNVGVRDITDLLRRHVRPNDRVLEVGCAPGKYLLWCAVVGQADVSGIEYAPKSHQQTVDLFRRMNVTADLRQEDFFNNSFAQGTFNTVYSLGLIEHFTGERLRDAVGRHVELLKPSGTALIIVPDFSGWYGMLTKWINRAVYETHNTDMMTVEAMLALTPAGCTATAYRYGFLSPWTLVYGTPKRTLARLAMYITNAIGLLQPIQIKALCPWLVLEIRRLS